MSNRSSILTVTRRGVFAPYRVVGLSVGVENFLPVSLSENGRAHTRVYRSVDIDIDMEIFKIRISLFGYVKLNEFMPTVFLLVFTEQTRVFSSDSGCSGWFNTLHHGYVECRFGLRSGYGLIRV